MDATEKLDDMFKGISHEQSFLKFVEALISERNVRGGRTKGSRCSQVAECRRVGEHFN
jgi:hypothetical protein